MLLMLNLKKKDFIIVMNVVIDVINLVLILKVRSELF